MTSNLKFPFLAALAFHAVALAGLGAWQPSVRNVIQEITPLAVIELPKEAPGAEVKAEVKKEEKAPPPPKVVKPEAPKPPEPEKKPVRVEAPQPVKEVKAEPVIEPVAEPVAEAPAPKVEAVAALPEAKVEVSAGSVHTSQSSAEPTQSVASHADHHESARQTADEMVYFQSIIWQKIMKSKIYPRWAKERGFEGVVGIQFEIDPDGGVSDIKVVKPCPSDILNKAACDAVIKAAPFNPRPKSYDGKKIVIKNNIVFKLDN